MGWRQLQTAWPLVCTERPVVKSMSFYSEFTRVQQDVML